MRIGVDCRELELGKVTGINRYLINFLSNTVTERPDCDLILYGNQKTFVPESLSHLRLRVIPEGWTLWWDQVLLPRALRENEVDVFLSPYIKGPLFAPCPYVTTIHDLLFLRVEVYTGWRRLLYSTLFKFWGALISRHASVIITVSRQSKKDIVELFKVSESKVVLIPNGLSAEFLQETAGLDRVSAVRQRYGITQPYVLYVGNFKPHKNLQRLVTAFKQVTEKSASRYQLVLAGMDHEHRPTVDKTVVDSGLQDSVVFTGFVRGEDLPILYREAEVFAFPSLYEGFGMPVLEAMACGTPVVTSRTTSLPEVIGDAGIIVDPYDVSEIARSILYLLTDHDARERCIRKGLERSKQFSLEKTGGKILKVLEDVLISS